MLIACRDFSSLSNGSHTSYTELISKHYFMLSDWEANLIKTSHRLISTTNLHLKESCLFSITTFLGTLHLSFISIIPSPGSSKYVLSFFAHKSFALIILFRDDILIGTGLTFQSVNWNLFMRWNGGRDYKGIWAGWTDYEVLSEILQAKWDLLRPHRVTF